MKDYNSIAGAFVSPTGRHRQIRECFHMEAREVIGELDHGCELFLFSRGQWSLMDLILAVLEQVGGCTMTVQTWTAAIADLEMAYRLVESDAIRDMRWIVDRSFVTRQPEYCQHLVDRFGYGCIRVLRTHAKFIMLRNDDWNIVIRTSANLNQNRRMENYEISDDPNLANYFQEFVDEVWEREREGCGLDGLGTSTESDEVFEQLVVRGEFDGRMPAKETKIGMWYKSLELGHTMRRVSGDYDDAAERMDTQGRVVFERANGRKVGMMPDAVLVPVECERT